MPIQVRPNTIPKLQLWHLDESLFSQESKFCFPPFARVQSKNAFVCGRNVRKAAAYEGFKGPSMRTSAQDHPAAGGGRQSYFSGSTVRETRAGERAHCGHPSDLTKNQLLYNVLRKPSFSNSSIILESMKRRGSAVLAPEMRSIPSRIVFTPSSGVRGTFSIWRACSA